MFFLKRDFPFEHKAIVANVHAAHLFADSHTFAVSAALQEIECCPPSWKSV
jgi:hypothetical protein